MAHFPDRAEWTIGYGPFAIFHCYCGENVLPAHWCAWAPSLHPEALGRECCVIQRGHVNNPAFGMASGHKRRQRATTDMVTMANHHRLLKFLPAFGHVIKLTFTSFHLCKVVGQWTRWPKRKSRPLSKTVSLEKLTCNSLRKPINDLYYRKWFTVFPQIFWN